MCKECWVGQHPILWRRRDEACNNIYWCMCVWRIRSETVERWRRLFSTKGLEWMFLISQQLPTLLTGDCVLLLVYITPKGLRPKYWSAMNTPDLSGCWNRSASCQGWNKTAVFSFYAPHIWNPWGLLSRFTFLLNDRWKRFCLPRPLH